MPNRSEAFRRQDSHLILEIRNPMAIHGWRLEENPTDAKGEKHEILLQSNNAQNL